jgi:hypothetical protein
MADLQATDVTITVAVRDRYILGKLKFVKATIAFGDAALTYPTGGVPMPTILPAFGMHKQLLGLVFLDGCNAGGYVYRYDADNNKIMMYYGDYSQSGDGVLVEDGGNAIAAQSITVLAIGE